jgi:hypothetical protein
MAKQPVNPKEETALEKFREVCKDLNQDDLTLLRFLRAREGDLSKAEDMLRKSVDWRKENKVETFLNYDLPKEIRNDFRFYNIGEDSEGYAVMYLPIGRWNIRDKIEMGFKEDAFTFRFHILENFMHHVEQTQQYQFVIVLDLTDCSYRKVAHKETIQVLLAAFRDFEANYPERLRAAYVINAPWVFSYVYAFIKPLLSGHTLSKVKIFDANVAAWKPVLMEKIPEKNLPQESLSALTI